MKTLIIGSMLAIISLSTGSVPTASFAEENTIRVIGLDGVGVSTTASVRDNYDESNKSLDARIRVNGNTTDIEKYNDDKDREKINDQKKEATTSDDHSLIMVSHRSNMMLFLLGLSRVANQEEGIGNRVRMIAREQNESASSTTYSMMMLQKRGSFKTFFIGTDFKNIGNLRSEYLKTENRIKILQTLVAETTSVEGKAELNLEISLLQKDQVAMEKFIAMNDGKFSLFGWFTRVFYFG